jgi:hypothetical protein
MLDRSMMSCPARKAGCNWATTLCTAAASAMHSIRMSLAAASSASEVVVACLGAGFGQLVRPSGSRR